MHAPILTTDGRLDLSNMPREKEFEEFWNTIRQQFNNGGAKYAAMAAWKVALTLDSE